MGTNRHSLETLTKSILNRLENNKMIVFNPRDRGLVHQELMSMMGKCVVTEEDLAKRVRDEVSGETEALSEQNITETEAFKSRKHALLKEIGENGLHGFYFQVPIRDIGNKVCKFLFDCKLIEDVFETDEEIRKSVVETIQNFDESKLS